jgi:hypothetical protein
MSYNDNYNQGGNRDYDDNRGRGDNYGGNSYGGNSYGGNPYGGDSYNGGQVGDSYNNNNNQGSSYGQQGGAEFNRPGGQWGAASHDFGSAAQHAEQHAGSSGSPGVFGEALGYLQNNMGGIQQSAENINEGHAVQAHQARYGDGGGQRGSQQHDSQTLGMGAAMQALHMFTGGGQGAAGASGAGAQGGQNQFIGMAMAQASKLFDEQSGQGNVVSLEFSLQPLSQLS